MSLDFLPVQSSQTSLFPQKILKQTYGWRLASPNPPQNLWKARTDPEITYNRRHQHVTNHNKTKEPDLKQTRSQTIITIFIVTQYNTLYS